MHGIAVPKRLFPYQKRFAAEKEQLSATGLNSPLTPSTSLFTCAPLANVGECEVSESAESSSIAQVASRYFWRSSGKTPVVSPWWRAAGSLLRAYCARWLSDVDLPAAFGWRVVSSLSPPYAIASVLLLLQY